MPKARAKTNGYVRLARHRYVVVRRGKVVGRVKSHDDGRLDTAGAGSGRLGPAQHVLVEIERCLLLRHVVHGRTHRRHKTRADPGVRERSTAFEASAFRG